MSVLDKLIQDSASYDFRGSSLKYAEKAIDTALTLPELARKRRLLAIVQTVFRTAYAAGVVIGKGGKQSEQLLEEIKHAKTN